MNNKTRVAVIFGGRSFEHEVSRVSAASIVRNIEREKYEVVTIGITKQGKWLLYNGPVELMENGQWESHAEKADSFKLPFISNGQGKEADARTLFELTNSSDKKIDVVFPVLHGFNGEDGTVQGFFELADIPYVGSGVLASAVGMDKAYSKIIFENAGIPQADYLVFAANDIYNNMDEAVEKIENKFTYPCFIKPSCSGSSVGITKAHDRSELEKGLKEAAKYDRKVLVEEFINGHEVECAVLGNDKPQASTVGEIIPSNEFYDYDAKYKDSNSKLIIPAELPFATIQQIREYAVEAFKALDCAGLARVDFFVHKETGKIYINEINTIPGFTSISMYPKLWEASGIPYNELIDRLIKLAIERHGESKRIFKNSI